MCHEVKKVEKSRPRQRFCVYVSPTALNAKHLRHISYNKTQVQVGLEPQTVKVKLIKIRFPVQSPTLIFISDTEKVHRKILFLTSPTISKKDQKVEDMEMQTSTRQIDKPRDF